MMNPVWKEKWLAALRSGEYQQGDRSLRNKDCYCCLGVLCDVVAKSPEGAGMKWSEKDEGFFIIGVDLFAGFLPKPIQDMTGVTAMGELGATYTAPLSSLNDRGYTFAQIADIIEEKL